jgi:hypothetical protein
LTAITRITPGRSYIAVAPTVGAVPGQLSNHAAELLARYVRTVYLIRNWTDGVESARRSMLTDDFVLENRRRLPTYLELGVEDASDHLKAFIDVSGGSIDRTSEVIAVSGDRLAVIRARRETVDGWVKEEVTVSRLATDLRFDRTVVLDPDDLDAALGLLDELAATHPEPVAVGAYEEALARLETFERAVESANAAED